MKKYLFAFTLLLCSQTITFAQNQNAGTMEANHAAQLYADSVKQANTIKGKVHFDGDPWTYIPQSLQALEDLYQVSLEVPLQPNTPHSGLWWVFSMKHMTKQIIPAKNPPATDSPWVRHANDTLLIKLVPQFNRNLTGDTSAMNEVRELRMKFWQNPNGVDGHLIGNWTIIYQHSYGNEEAIATEMSLGHLSLLMPDNLNAEFPVIWGFQWEGDSDFPQPLIGTNGNMQLMLYR